MTASAKVASLMPSIAAGGIAVLVGFVSSIAIIFQAASTAGASPEQTGSWLFALCLGAGIVSIGFSFYYKMPILAAWSTPGAALLGTSLIGVPINQAIGAFVLCGVLITISGATGWFERVVNRIPVAIASAMLAGILLRFGLDVFVSIKAQPVMVLSMLLTYFAAKRYYPRYAVIGVLLVGLGVAVATGQLHFDNVSASVAHPVFTMPEWSWSVLLSVGVPLFVVTMASQNLPGVAVMKASGYHPPVSAMITGTGIATLLLAPFGAFGINMAAITAAICTSEEAHKDPSQRYVAAISAGVVYLVLGLFSAMISGVFSAFPKELVLALSGIALLATIANSLTVAVREDKSREAAVITFLVTASGLSLFGVGAAFWGLVAGTVALIALKPRVPAAR